MNILADTRAVDAVRAAARPLHGPRDDTDADHEPLLALIGDAPLVLLGEASHGTHEFYRERARITRRLIEQKGFSAVAIEGDWPDAYRVNRYVRGASEDGSADAALAGFRRFPTWMWRNTVVAGFVDWLRGFNAQRAPAQRCGFYGLDLYSLHSSMAAVLAHLERSDPGAAARARERYACFDQFGEDSQVYGLMTGLGSADNCEAAVTDMLAELRRRAAAVAGAPHGDAEAAFDAEQNARLVKNAEAYYRTMYQSEVSSWNQRDRHMMEMLSALRRHLARQSGTPAPKVVVWAHNSHLGDARATEMGEYRDELNLGQLVREHHGADAVLVGFSTHTGSVTAASDWGGRAERKAVRPSREDSVEGLMHATGLPRFLLPLRGDRPLAHALRLPRLERAIGVIYRPETERQSHYFFARLPQQFDALIHLDHSRALHPLEPEPGWLAEHQAALATEPPETYPSGL